MMDGNSIIPEAENAFAKKAVNICGYEFGPPLYDC
jgi:hypothetical protein